MVATKRPGTLGYSPQYPSTPFTDFESINPQTNLESLNLNWREKDLPERIRTKHVHRLHPYLGKFIPQLVEIFLRKYNPSVVCDPFCGSGTTLVEASVLGINAIGNDISQFNSLLTKVKTDKYDLEALEFEILDILERSVTDGQPRLMESKTHYRANEFLASWFAPEALETLLVYRELIGNYQHSDVLKIILSRSARSARLTTHFDLDFPKKPQTEPYHCYKHSRTCKPTSNAAQFLKRYSKDTIKRIREYSDLRRDVDLTIINDDVRNTEFPEFDLVITSPPYVGLIDYHEQHRYAYELLGLPWRAEAEIGPANRGSSQKAQRLYVKNMIESFASIRRSLSPDGKAVVIVNDKLNLYEEIARESGFEIDLQLERHVNRRTGRRAGNFFESVFVWNPK